MGFLYGAGAETLIVVTGISGKYPKLFVSRQKTKVSCGYPENQEKLVFGYPVLRSTPQRWIPELRFGYPPLTKFPKSFWEKLGIFLESLGGSQRQLCIKTRPLFSRYSIIMNHTVNSRISRKHDNHENQYTQKMTFLRTTPARHRPPLQPPNHAVHDLTDS